MKYDLIVIGSGPAGLTAALYAVRYDMNVLVLGKVPGGVANEAFEICNFPGEEKIMGVKLMMKWKSHVESLGVEVKMESVTDVLSENGFKVKTDKEEYQARKIIFANGTRRSRMGIAREDELKGKGLSYCATCDAAFFKEKTVGVIGGGSAALTAALLLSKFADKVYLMYRRDAFFRAEPAWVKEVEANKKIEVMFNSKVTELLGEEKLEGVKLESGENVSMDGLFIEIGSIPETDLAEKLGVKLDGKYIKVNSEKKTNIKGIFAAGDITNTPLKQIITAASDGAIAAKTAYEELITEHEKEDKK